MSEAKKSFFFETKRWLLSPPMSKEMQKKKRRKTKKVRAPCSLGFFPTCGSMITSNEAQSLKKNPPLPRLLFILKCYKQYKFYFVYHFFDFFFYVTYFTFAFHATPAMPVQIQCEDQKVGAKQYHFLPRCPLNLFLSLTSNTQKSCLSTKMDTYTLAVSRRRRSSCFSA